jgi:hypothetical protein
MDLINADPCRVAPHGRRQIEIGVQYPLSRRQRCVFRVDAYFFTPHALGLSKTRYGVQRFFWDLSSYVRFTPAALSFEKLADSGCELSPLTRIARALDAAALPAQLDARGVLYEIRIFVNIFNHQCHETRRLLVALARQGSDAGGLASRVAALVEQGDACLRRFRALRERFCSPVVPESLRMAVAWADESVSLKAEKERFRLYRAFQKQSGLESGAEALKPFLESEQAYRRRQRFQTVIVPSRTESGETFLYRESMLKKWAQTALYMKLVPDRLIPRIVQVLAGAAAGAAMAFAVIATFLAQRLFAMYSVPWMILIVVAYVFKDRIKESGRGFLLAFVPRLVADESKSLVDRGSGRRVGKVRSRVRFCSPKQVPLAVLEARNASANPFYAIMPAENVLHYHSTLRVDAAALLSGHPRLEAITNILRLRLDAWFSGMDDPTETVRFLHDGRVEEMQANRVYHAHLIVGLSEKHDGEPPRFSRFLLVLNRDGLVRIETPDGERNAVGQLLKGVAHA